jgi:hypothetical protein
MRYPEMVHVQAADAGLKTMHVELRPYRLDNDYSVECGDADFLALGGF